MSQSDTPPLPEALRLSAIEARVLGCLIEKEATTPDQYPLTENAVVVASNQKTNREPTMELSLGEIGHALRQLEPRHLVRSIHGSRAQRYEHRFDTAYSVTAQQQALLCCLMLRGPQTLGELHTRSQRLASFAGSDDISHALQRLAEREEPLVLRLPKAPGQREDRYAHLLCGPVDISEAAPIRTPRATEGGDLAARIDELEARILALETSLQGDPSPD
jgi:uncharacterized protein YceH (UPF0502 family)